MKKNLIAYIDGSYSSKVATDAYGSGIVLIHSDNKQEHFSRRGTKAVELNNVAGELSAAMFAMKKAKEYGYSNLIIYHDYIGISNWIDGTWRGKNVYVKQYIQYYMEHIKPYVDVSFVKVKAHSHDIYNDLADRLAKQALRG